MAWNFNPNLPIYAQIIQEMKRRMIRHELSAGERIPSVRDLAKEAGVNPNTMQKALADLEAEGLLDTERTAGRFITSDGEKLAALRKNYLQERLAPLLQELQDLGVTPEELGQLTSQYFKEETP